MLYNISHLDLKFSSQKIFNQKDYLSSNTFLTRNGELKTLLDISMSANISSRYYAQLANKVNTLQQVMCNQGLEPVFLTITLDGVYHDLLHGDYDRFTLFHQKKLPENQSNGFLKTKASLREPFSERDLYQIIRFQWASFQNSRVYRKMKKEGYKVGYLFSVEPHKSGVPHAHILLYLPKHYIELLKKEFINKFWAKQNILQDKNRLSPDQIKNGEINGYQWTLTNPVGYVMKYCTKSFIDIKNNSELDELQAWYIKNKIIRITTSHSLVPQWVYNKIYPLEKDWLYLSTLNLKSGSCEWSFEDDFFSFKDENLEKELKYDKGLYQIYVRNNLIHQFGEKKEDKSNIKSYRVYKKPKLREKKKIIPVEIIINGVSYSLYKKPVSKMSDFDLYRYYKDLNIESCNLHHFGVVKNELIKRGLIDGEIQSLNDFNTDFNTKIGA